jgi:hypothetical protein
LLQNDLTVNIHDICSSGMLRMVSPELFVEALKQNNLDVKDVGFGSDEGRIDFGDFKINNHKIQYQVCGLFAGDEHITFPKGTPKELVDKVLGVLQLTIAEEMLQHHNRKLGFVVTPSEALATMENNLVDYRDKELTRANSEISEAKEVLKGKRSFFNTILKDYKPPPTLGEAIARMAIRMTILDEVVTEKMKRQSATLRYLVKSYIEWKIKITGFENLHNSFQQKIKENFEGLSTSPDRGWGPLNKKQQKEIKYLKNALANQTLIESAIKQGDKILPELKKQLESATP